MKWNPLINALAATTYITLAVTLIHFLESIRHNTPDTFIDGIGALSLLVFSAATMAFLFFYQPVILPLESKQAEAVSYFLKTLFIFGITTGSIMALVIFQ